VFIPNPDNLPVVNHKDGNKKNNNVLNLEWSTYSDNMRHSWQQLGIYKNRKLALPRGEANKNAKLTAMQVKEIRARYIPRRVGAHLLAKEYGVSKPAIRSILARKTWAHVE
jgi:hypothetical protein